jgi:protein SCO1/2
VAALAAAGSGCSDGGGRDSDAGDGARSAAGSSLEALPGALYDPPRPASPIRLSDDQGAAFDPATRTGHVTLVFFGFTECPDVCPLTLQRWADVRAALGPDSSIARFLFVSVDPENDTPEEASAYARRYHPTFRGFSGTRAEVEETALAWGVAPGRTHTSQVFVVDAKGMVRWGYGRSATVETIARGIRTIRAAA